MAADQVVRSYKLWSNVEQAFRCLKSVDLMVRPIRHRLEDRVRAHIFLCMLAYYVQWHMMEAWRPLLFADEDQDGKATRDPVAAAERSEPALQKVHSKRLEDDYRAQSETTESPPATPRHQPVAEQPHSFFKQSPKNTGKMRFFPGGELQVSATQLLFF